MLRLVLDTNVWLDWLLFDDPAVAPIRKAVAEGKAEVVMDEATESELARVLAYTFNNRTLDAATQASLLEQCRRTARKVEGGSRKEEGTDPRPTTHDPRVSGSIHRSPYSIHAVPTVENPLPVCSDADDQKFLELALACGAAFLVTRDGALLELAEHKVRPLPYRIVTPVQLAKALRQVTS
jgi:uncharacterized protein